MTALANPVTLHLLSFDGPFVNGIPTYPYTLLIGGEPFIGMCDDYYHGGTPGDKWHANLTNLGSGDLSLVRFASSGLVAYQEAAWILLQTRTTAPVQWPDMNFAVWHIFSPSVPIDAQAQSWIMLAQLESQKQFPNVDFHVIEIATPVGRIEPSYEPQEFMYITPEPGSVILLGSGVLGIAGTLRRKLKS
jgi:PEP-CTERM motif